MYRKKYGIIVYENINLSFFENKKSSDSVLKGLVNLKNIFKTLPDLNEIIEKAKMLKTPS